MSMSAGQFDAWQLEKLLLTTVHLHSTRLLTLDEVTVDRYTVELVADVDVNVDCRTVEPITSDDVIVDCRTHDRDLMLVTVKVDVFTVESITEETVSLLLETTEFLQVERIAVLAAPVQSFETETNKETMRKIILKRTLNEKCNLR